VTTASKINALQDNGISEEQTAVLVQFYYNVLMSDCFCIQIF